MDDDVGFTYGVQLDGVEWGGIVGVEDCDGAGKEAVTVYVEGAHGGLRMVGPRWVGGFRLGRYLLAIVWSGSTFLCGVIIWSLSRRLCGGLAVYCCWWSSQVSS